MLSINVPELSNKSLDFEFYCKTINLHLHFFYKNILAFLSH